VQEPRRARKELPGGGGAERSTQEKEQRAAELDARTRLASAGTVKGFEGTGPLPFERAGRVLAQHLGRNHGLAQSIGGERVQIEGGIAEEDGAVSPPA